MKKPLKQITEAVAKKNLEEIEKAISEKLFTIQDVSKGNYRTINHWAEKELLLSPKDDSNKWKKFSFAELIWIKIIEELRSMGVSLDLVNRIKYDLGTPEDMNPLTYQENVKGKSYKALNYDLLEKKFTGNLTMCICERSLCAIHILKDGTCEFIHSFEPIIKGFNDDLPKRLNDSYKKGFKSFISISVSDLIADFISNSKFETIHPLKILNEDELEVLNYLREGKLKSITVKFKDEEIETIELTRTKNKVDIESRFLDHILKGGYQDVSFTTQGGKIVTFTQTIKKKIKKEYGT